jgi:alkylation response protein AidB-like acyl-CoA dehydrogenase
MDVKWSAADLAFRDEVRRLLDDRLTPELRPAGRLMTSVYSDHEASMAWQRRLHGWTAPAWPVECGGCDWSITRHYFFSRESTLAGAPALSPMGIRMVAHAIVAYGTSEQKAYFLPDILTGEVFFCQGYSEPESGSDLASLSMSAVDDGDHLMRTGSKIWTTHATEANWMFGLVRTSRMSRKQHGITFVLIDMTSPGIAIHPLVMTSGEEIQNQVFFGAVRVPKANVLGDIDDRWTVAKYLLEFERGGGATTGCCMGRRSSSWARHWLLTCSSQPELAAGGPTPRGSRCFSSILTPPIVRRESKSTVIGLSTIGAPRTWFLLVCDCRPTRYSATQGRAGHHLHRPMTKARRRSSSEAVGCMRKVLADTVEYCKQRRQFGQPIGSFQVLQHRMVDMYMELEQAAAAVYLAVLNLEAEPTTRASAVSAAKATIGRAARFIGHPAVQLHGGMGMTEELALGHYFKRLTAIRYEFGSTDHHRALCPTHSTAAVLKRPRLIAKRRCEHAGVFGREGRFDVICGSQVEPVFRRVVAELQHYVGVVDDLGDRFRVFRAASSVPLGSNSISLNSAKERE